MGDIAGVSWACQVHLHSWAGRRTGTRNIYRTGIGTRKMHRTPTVTSISITCSCHEEQSSTLRTIQKCGVVACLRAKSAGLALETARVALDEGISLVIAELVLEYPSALIGAGTVLTCEDAKNAELAGAKFVMSPAIVSNILEIFKDTHILYIPGAMTPTEVLNAHAFGARLIKIYPVTVLGGEQYIQALRRSFHHIPMVASQGITMETMDLYIRMGASAVVLSDAIFNKTAMATRDFGLIKKLAALASSKGKAAVRECCSSSA